MAELPGSTLALIDRLKAVDPQRVTLDRPKAEAAFAEHLELLKLPPRPVRWIEDAGTMYRYLFDAAWDAAWAAAWDAAWAAAWDAAWAAARDAAWAAARAAAWDAAWAAARDAARAAAWDAARAAAWDAAWAAAWAAATEPNPFLPFVDLYEAGVFLFVVRKTEIVAIPAPSISLDDRELLHLEDGPAVFWPTGERYHFWHGVRVPEQVIEAPETLRAQDILKESNIEVRRVMIDRVGAERFLQEAGAKPIQSDDFGTLYRIEFPDDEDLVMVKVVNSSPEPDGSFKDYFLRVPPRYRTARGAVAWTFGQTTTRYRPKVET